MNEKLIFDYENYLSLERGYSSNTVSAYLNDINHFNIFIKKDLLKVNASDLRMYLKHISNLSSRTISHNIMLVK